MERLTQPEEEALHLLWRSGGGFIKDVLDGLPDPRPPYTTLASTLRNLERKGYVRAEKLGNAFRYQPLMSADDHHRHSLGVVVSQHFRDSYKELVSFFVKDKKISADDLQDLLRMIAEQKAE